MAAGDIPHRAEFAEEVEEILWGHVEAQILDEQSTARGQRRRREAAAGGRQKAAQRTG